MSRWIRYRHEGSTGFGTLDDGRIAVHEGDAFDRPRSTGERLPLDAVEVLTPCEPTKMIALFNNFRAAADKNGWPAPREPLYLFLPPSSFLPTGATIVKPRSHDGPVIYEGELGIVIGRRCKDVSAADADDRIFGYTCVNDVTAKQLIHEDELFAQWCRAKAFDTFGVFGPVIATDVDPLRSRVKTAIDGDVLQDYPLDDMFFPPAELVQRLSRDMTLEPGDLIACGTSLGASPMEPGCTVEVEIEGIGILTNTFE